ncbi:MFS transporter [Sanguibacter sp. 25GB23B1]|uniref:MFS transporter n=1 Tax=unclassified Sanguibacter TaxID=2645534 RepID=UPI0032AFD2BE
MTAAQASVAVTGGAGAPETAGGSGEARAARPRLPPRLRRQIVITCCLVASAQVTWGAIVPALPRYGVTFSASSFLLGAIVAAFGVGRLLVNVPAGLLADRFGPRRLLLGALVGLVVVTVLTAFAPTLPVLLVARFLAGVLGGSVVTVGLALVTARAPADARGTVLATAQAVQLAGGAMGPVVGGLVLDRWGLHAVFFCAAIPAVGCLLWTLLRPDPEFWASPAPAAGAHRTPSSEATVRSRRVTTDLAAFVGLNVVGFAVFVIRFGGEQSLVPILGDRVGMSSTQLGLSIGVITLVSLGLLPLLARLLDTGWRRRLLVPGMLVAAVAVGLYPVAESPLAFAVLVVVAGVGAAVGGIVPGVVLADVAAPGRQGAAVGIFRSTGDLGAVVGPLALGLALDHWGAGSASLALAAVAGGSAVVYLVLVRGRRVLTPPTRG